MVELPPILDLPVIEPPAIVQEVRKRRGTRGTRGTRATRGGNAPGTYRVNPPRNLHIYVGLWLLLGDDDCQVTRIYNDGTIDCRVY